MIIVYISLIVIGLALIWFVIRMVSHIKGIKNEIIKMGKQVEKVREKTEEAKKEQVSAFEGFQSLEKTYKRSVDQVTFTAGQGKDFVETIKHSQKELKNTLPFFPRRRHKEKSKTS